MSGAIANTTAALCSATNKVSIRASIDALLDADETNNTDNAISTDESGCDLQTELTSAYSLTVEPKTSKGKSTTKTIHLTTPELNLMVLGYKEIFGIDVGQFDIEPHVSACIVKERDSYVIFKSDYSEVCCLREPIDPNSIQGGQMLYTFTDITEDGETHRWALLDTFPICRIRRGFLKYKTTNKRRLLVPLKCISQPVITACFPKSLWRWFININVCAG